MNPHRPLPYSLVLFLLALLVIVITLLEWMSAWAFGLVLTPGTVAVYAFEMLIPVALFGLWRLKQWGVVLSLVLLAAWELNKLRLGFSPGTFFVGMVAALACVIPMIPPSRPITPLRKNTRWGLGFVVCVCGALLPAGRFPVIPEPFMVAALHPFAETGHPHAQYRLGFAYGMGVGAPEDEALARQWLQRSADQGDTNAQTLLARMNRATAPRPNTGQ
jgi:hypothetical protein